MLTIPSDFSISRCNQFLPTSSDHVVDSDNIFIVGVAVVILHTHLCISCRCMLNKTKDQLNSVWFMLFSRGYYNAETIFKHFSVQGNSDTKTRWNSFETVPKDTETQVTNRRVYLFYRIMFPYLEFVIYMRLLHFHSNSYVDAVPYAMSYNAGLLFPMSLGYLCHYLSVYHIKLTRSITYLNPSGNSVTTWPRTISIVVVVTAFWRH